LEYRRRHPGNDRALLVLGEVEAFVRQHADNPGVEVHIGAPSRALRRVIVESRTKYVATMMSARV
jgi:hypothetical protein